MAFEQYGDERREQFVGIIAVGMYDAGDKGWFDRKFGDVTEHRKRCRFGQTADDLARCPVGMTVVGVVEQQFVILGSADAGERLECFDADIVQRMVAYDIHQCWGKMRVGQFNRRAAGSFDNSGIDVPKHVGNRWDTALIAQWSHLVERIYHGCIVCVCIGELRQQLRKRWLLLVLGRCCR